MTDEVHVVVTGNSQTRSMTIEGVYADEDAALLHYRGLLYKGWGTGSSSDYAELYTYTPRDSVKDDVVEPDFDYRVKFEGVLIDDEGVTPWIDDYDTAVEIVGEIREQDEAALIWMQRRNRDDDVEKTRRNSFHESDPWENTWSRVRDPEESPSPEEWAEKGGDE